MALATIPRSRTPLLKLFDGTRPALRAFQPFCYCLHMHRAILVVCLLFSILIPHAFGKERYQHAGPIHLDRDGQKWAEKTLKKLSAEEKVGQLFMIWVRARFYNVDDPDLLQLRETMKRDHIGSFGMTVPVDGPFLIKTGPYEAAMILNQLQRDSNLPHAMAFGAAGKLDYAESFGRVTAQEARAIGVEWNFFPVADANSNPANPIINTRSFGEDQQQVGDLVAAYIRGARAAGMLTTAKYFHDHGST